MLSSLLLRRRDPATPRPVALALFAAALVLPLVGAIVAQPARPTLAAPATTTTGLNLRSSPSMGNNILTVIPGGATVEITGNAQGGWYPVTYNGTSGWAYGDFLSTGGGGATASATGTASTTVRLNLRSGPSLSDGVITVMPVGATVTLTGNSSNGFVSVTYNGTAGWAYADFLGSGGGNGASAQSNDGGGATGTASTTVRLNLRSGPSLSDGVITVMPVGATVTLTGNSSNGFVSVDYNGTAGWAYADFLGSGGSAGNDGGSNGGNNGAVTGSACATVNLNLRAGASTGTAVLTVIPAGGTVSVTGNAQSGFHPVTYGGQNGWAASNFLNFDGNCNAAPAPNPGAGANDDVIAIIYAAADRYGQSREAMLRVARCESNLNPRARNPSSGASGLFQFMPGTWASTPYANYDIFDAWASANAAGWMWSVGRRNEWVCQ